jgi:hypothetical protein
MKQLIPDIMYDRTDENGDIFARAYLSYLYGKYASVYRPNRLLNADGDTAFVVFSRPDEDGAWILTTQIDFDDRIHGSNSDTLRYYNSRKDAISYVNRNRKHA